MGTLNPDLLSKDLDDVMNDAVALKDQYRKPVLIPELLLLALLRHPDTVAARLLDIFKNSKNVDMARLDRQVQIAIETGNDEKGNLDFIAKGNRSVPLSSQTIVLIDDALSLANFQDKVRVDTDHILASLAEASMSTCLLLRQHSITPRAIQNVNTEAKIGRLRAVYFREGLLRDIINILSQAVNRHIILVGPDGVGKRTLVYSLGLLISEGKGPAGINNLVQIDEAALLDNDHNAVRTAMSLAAGGSLLIPHLHRFFGGPINADFSTKAMSLIHNAFLGDNPVIIGTTTEQKYDMRLATIRVIGEMSQIVRVPEASVEETIEMLKILKPQLEADYHLEVKEDALALAAWLAKRYLTTSPLPHSAEKLLHRTAAMVKMSQQNNLAFKPQLPDNSLDPEDITLVISQITGIPINKLNTDEVQSDS